MDSVKRTFGPLSASTGCACKTRQRMMLDQMSRERPVSAPVAPEHADQVYDLVATNLRRQ